MADVAHDAPASPKPGIAPQQASRPDSPDRGKLRVFISYSRDDLKFADQLDAALNACGFECLIDRHGISGGEEWKRRLGNLISEADTVVFVLSPTSELVFSDTNDDAFLAHTGPQYWPRLRGVDLIVPSGST